MSTSRLTRTLRWLGASSLRLTLALLVVVSTVAVVMVWWGNELLGRALLQVLGPDPAVQFTVGLLWTVTAWALCLCSDQVRSRRVRRAMVAGGTAMFVLAFLVEPAGRPSSASGAGEYAPAVGLGLLVGLPVGGGLLWLLRRPLREARRREQEAREEGRRQARDRRRYHQVLARFRGDVEAAETALYQERWTTGAPVPARPPDVAPPARGRRRRRRR